jgi:hypothetical protein
MGARNMTFANHGTDYGTVYKAIFFPYYSIATPHQEGIHYPATGEVLASSEPSPVLKFKTDKVHFTLINNK